MPNWRRQRPSGDRERELTDREALLRLVPWCEPFSPAIGLEDSPQPECLLLDVTGSVSLFHGEAALVEHAVREFLRRGLIIRAALADTIGAAWAAAHYAAAELQGTNRSAIVLPPGHGLAGLATLPVEALRLAPETARVLRELGLAQIGQLADLPRTSLAARFGAELLLRLDQAAGEAAEVIVAEQPPPAAQADWTFEQPTDRQELLEWALDRLVENLVGQLADSRRGVQQLECRIRGQTHSRTQFVVGLFRPSASPRRLSELIKLQLESQTLAEPTAALELSVTSAAPLEQWQQELFDADLRRDDPRALALLIDRLSNRLGREAVARVRLLPDAQPEFAWRYEPAIGAAARRKSSGEPKAPKGRSPRRGAAPLFSAHSSTRRLAALARPLRLFARPVLLTVVSVAPHGPPLAFSWNGVERRVERTWGPERIQTGWWRGRSALRDYYRVETAEGEWFWLFRQLTDRRWFLHGVFE